MINRKVSRLNAQQGPRLKDDVPATIATNRCVGYEIAMMDERRIFIENKAATMDLQELAPIKSGIDQIRHRPNPASTKSGTDQIRHRPPGGRTERQAAAVRERHGKTAAPRRGTVAQDCLVPHRPQLRQIDLDQHRGNPRQILLGAHAPARGGIANPVVAQLVGQLHGLVEYMARYRELDVPAHATTNRIRTESEAPSNGLSGYADH